MNVFAELSHREGGIIDPWDFQDPAANPPSPCRTIPITDEIRAKDAADRAAREKRPDWAIKAELSQDNLHLVRRPVGPGRIEPRPRVARPRPPKKEWPHCACGARISWNRTECPSCLKARQPARTRPACGQCGANMAWKRTEPLCPKCLKPKRESKPAPAPRLPAPVPATELIRVCKCGRRLRPSNARDTCFECAGLILTREQRLSRRVKCATKTCTRLLRFGRTEGLCCDCMDRTASRKETTDRYRRKKIAEAGKTCKVCGVPIKWDTKSGCCIKHAAQLRSTRVILHAASREEHELNVLWASLSLEDKWAVLEDSLQGGQEDAERCEVSAGS